MQIGHALAMPAIESHRIKSRVFAVARVETHAQERRLDRGQHVLELILEFDESRRVRVHRHLQTEFLRAHLGDRPDPVQESGTRRAPQSLRLAAAPGGWRAPR